LPDRCGPKRFGARVVTEWRNMLRNGVLRSERSVGRVRRLELRLSSASTEARCAERSSSWGTLFGRGLLAVVDRVPRDSVAFGPSVGGFGRPRGLCRSAEVGAMRLEADELGKR
jgi:hypothetical protein